MIYRDDPEISKKYKSKKWQSLRKQKLLLNPFCERCYKNGIYNSAYIIHHKEYVTNKNYKDNNIFFNIDNLESLCQDCHNKEHFKNKVEYVFDAEGNLIKSKK